MISFERFQQLMNTEFVMNMLTTHKCDEMIVTPDEILHQFKINSKRNGKDLNYSIMYHTICSKNDEKLISSITDDNYNTLIRWNEEKYEFIPYRTNVSLVAIDVLLYLMNEAVDLPLTLKEDKKKMTKQKKKVYPNIFNKDNGASIKDVQIYHKKGKTTTTVVWSDLDEKGKNRITKVSCPNVCATTETGIAMCIAKRYFGGRNEFKRVAGDVLVLHNRRAVAREHRAEVKAKKKEKQS